jgi:hypothetical protein
MRASVQSLHALGSLASEAIDFIASTPLERET